MKFKWLVLGFALVLSLLIVNILTVFGSEAVTIVFDDSKRITKTDLFDNFKGVIPGDKLTQHIIMKNGCSDYDYIKVYMRAEADNKDAFLANLSMTVDVDGKKIFSGTPNETGLLSENVMLGTLDKNESVSLNVQLDVPIEMGDEFANTSGEVDWIFTIEALNYDTTPQTGDASLILVYLILTLISFVSIIIFHMKRKK